MRVIIHADDFGLNAETLEATISGFLAGTIASASILPGAECTLDAIRFAKSHPEFSFGVHLDYHTNDPLGLPPPATWDEKIVDYFPASQQLRWRALRGRISPDATAREAEAQLGFFRDHGMAISHVDSHGSMHKFAVFREGLARALPRFGITKMRTAQNLYLSHAWLSPTYWLGNHWHRKIRKHWKTTDFFYMHHPSEPKDWGRRLERLLGRSGTIEVGVHPGNSERWRINELKGAGEFADLCRDRGVEMITWSDL